MNWAPFLRTGCGTGQGVRNTTAGMTKALSLRGLRYVGEKRKTDKCVNVVP